MSASVIAIIFSLFVCLTVLFIVLNTLFLFSLASFQKPYARLAVFLQDHDRVGENNVGQGGELRATISLRPPHQPPHSQDRGLYTAVPFLLWLVVAGVVLLLVVVVMVLVLVLDVFDLCLESC